VGAHSSAVEHLTFNQRVVGSNPAGLTNKIKDLTQKQNGARLFLDSKLILRSSEQLCCRSLNREVRISCRLVFQVFDLSFRF
jgi:hypothetical protein